MLTLDQFHNPSIDYPDWLLYESDYIECTIDAHKEGGFFARVYEIPYSEFDCRVIGYGDSPQECLDWINREMPKVLARIRNKLVDACQFAEESLANFDTCHR